MVRSIRVILKLILMFVLVILAITLFSFVIMMPLLKLLWQWVPLLRTHCLEQFISWKAPSTDTNLVSHAISAFTTLIILIGTIVALLSLQQSMINQNLSTLATLTNYYDKYRNKRIRIFTRESVTEKDMTSFSNFLDGFGHIIWQLPSIHQNMAVERWSETFIRSWIRLEGFVYQKRPKSIGRDYPYFEWLASKAFDFQNKNFKNQKMHFYEYQDDNFNIVESWESYEENKDRGFCLKYLNETQKENTKLPLSEGMKVKFLRPEEIKEKYLKSEKGLMKILVNCYNWVTK